MCAIATLQMLQYMHKQFNCLIGCRVLELLRWRLGTFVLGGTAAFSHSMPFVQPFTDLSLASRERILQGWANSTIPKFLEVRTAMHASIM